MVTLELSTVINRPLEGVLAFLSNPENGPKRSSGSNDVTTTSAGPLGMDATYRSVRTALGRRIESEIEFTAYEQNRSYAQKTTSGHIPVESQATVERVEGGTRVTNHQVVDPGGFFKLAEPVLVRMIKRQFDADFANLKDLTESHGV
jgi:carbon monoxide dehydrogenase subunit G